MDEAGKHARRINGRNRKASPLEIRQIHADYAAGRPVIDIQLKYGISRSTLYRWMSDVDDGRSAFSDSAIQRARIEDLERCVVKLVMKVQALESELQDTNTKYITKTEATP